MEIDHGKPGVLLRRWRTLRGKSQLELSLETGVSQRHISFVESGRSRPSRQMVVDLSQGLDIPFRERNAVLLAAGYAPLYSEAGWDDPQMLSVTRATDRLLKQHDPYPAVVMDRHWNVVRTNESAPRLFSRFVDLQARPKPRNLLHLMFDPAGMRPFIVDWPVVSKALLDRVLRESVGGIVDETTQGLLEALRAYPHVVVEPTAPDAPTPLPVIPIGFDLDGILLRYFSMITTVGTPRTIATQEFRIESMFPADEATEHAHRALMAGPTDRQHWGR